MPAKRLSMRKIKEVLRLKASGMSNRKIAQSCGVSRPTVGEYLQRASRAGVTWPLPEGLSDAALEYQLFPEPPTPAQRDQALPDWLYIQKEFRRKHVTLFLLWEEYRAYKTGTPVSSGKVEPKEAESEEKEEDQEGANSEEGDDGSGS